MNKHDLTGNEAYNKIAAKADKPKGWLLFQVLWLMLLAAILLGSPTYQSIISGV